MPTDTETPTRPRPPAGGLDARDAAGRLLTMDGVSYLVGEDGVTLIKLGQARGTLTPAERAEIGDLIGAAETNPAGNPYRTGAA